MSTIPEKENTPEEAAEKASQKASAELEAAKIKQDKEKVKLDNHFQVFLTSLKKYLKSLTSLKEGIDHEGTAEGIRNDVEFRGHAAWILVCSILIACLGLNTNSAAIIIGAMLISPLMGPILGVGFAAGTNDGDLLVKSLKNYGSTIFISLLMSTLYFYFTPFKEINAELFSRTSATIYAIMVAFIGGSAGIIAGSRSLKSNVVPGVAIATALMPPLCTAGYGLAIGNLSYFLGAFYLFFINSVFIALPTYLYIRYLRFPVKQFVDPKKEKKIKNYIFGFIFLVMIPSVITFWNVLQRTITERNITQYNAYIESETAKYDVYVLAPSHVNDGDSISCTYHLKGDLIPENRIQALKGAAADFDLEPAHITITQDKDIESIINRLSKKESSEISQKDIFINSLEKENSTLRSEVEKMKSQLDLNKKVEDELVALYPKMKHKYLYRESSGKLLNLIYTWDESLMTDEIEVLEESLMKWLPKRLEVDSVVFTKFN